MEGTVTIYADQSMLSGDLSITDRSMVTRNSERVPEDRGLSSGAAVFGSVVRLRSKSMKRKFCLYIWISSLAVTGCSGGSKATGRQQSVIATPSSALQVNKRESGSSQGETARLVTEAVEVPQPGAEGIFVDEQHAWVADELAIKGSPNGTKSWGLARTTDGGRVWLQLRPSTQTNPLGWLQHYHWRMNFISPSRGWLGGKDSTWETDDGGLTWRRIFSASFDDLKFGDEQHGWMNIADKSGQQSHITDDGGETWRPCGPKRYYSRQVPEQPSYFLTSQIGWTITTKADKRDPRITTKGVAITKDGGCSWEQLWVNSDQDARFYDIFFVDQFSGWLAGERILLCTWDAGKTWSQVPRPRTDANVLEVHFLNANEGWIITAYSSMRSEETGVYRTTDSGDSWRQLSESELLDGFSEGGKRIQIPANWRAGKLLQMLLVSRAKNRDK